MSSEQKSRGRSKLLFLALLLFIAGVLAWQWYTRNLESTDDAFIDRHLVYIAPRVTGVMSELAVTDNQFVHQGEVIARLDPSAFNVEVEAEAAKVESARAKRNRVKSERDAFSIQLNARRVNATASIMVAKEDVLRQEAELTTLDARIQQSKREVERYQQLRKRQQVSKQTTEEAQTRLDTLESQRKSLSASLDVANAKLHESKTAYEVVQADEQQLSVYDASYKQAEAALQLANAGLDAAKLHLEWTTLKAPQDGWISKISARPGSQVSPGKAIGILVVGKPWIAANFKETQIGKMHVGDRAKIVVEALNGLELKGHVDSFQAGTGARFSLLPPENATGNFVKVVQRLPVKIVIDTPLAEKSMLWAGLSAVVTVDVSSHD
jgi:membrane fusion protein (multidrug efflux system)